MLPQLLPLGQSRLLVCQRIDALNLAQPLNRHKRTVRGETVEVETKPKAVALGARSFALYLLQRLRRRIATLRNLPLQLQQVHHTDTGRVVPSITYNCVEMARRLGTCERSIRTYVKQLIEARIVLRKVTHGSRANVELWISPDVVLETPEIPAENAQTADSTVTPLAVLLDPIRKNLPPKRAEQEPQQEPSEHLQGNVHRRATGTPFTGTEGPHNPAEPAPTAPSDPATAGKTATETLRRARAGGLPVERQDAMVASFASLVLTKLYANQRGVYSLERVEKAVRAGVFQDFQEEMPVAQWEEFYRNLLRRVKKVQDYLAKRPTYALRAPYAQVVGGTGYFDVDNPYGFQVTGVWLEQDIHKARVDDAVTELRCKQRYDAAADPRRVKVKVKRVKEMSMLELFQFHQHRLYRLGGEKLVHRFFQEAHKAKIRSSR